MVGAVLVRERRGEALPALGGRAEQAAPPRSAAAGAEHPARGLQALRQPAAVTDRLVPVERLDQQRPRLVERPVVQAAAASAHAQRPIAHP